MNENTSKTEKFRPFQDKAPAWIGAICALITLGIFVFDRLNHSPMNLIEEDARIEDTITFNSETLLLKDIDKKPAQKKKEDKKDEALDHRKEDIENKSQTTHTLRLLIDEKVNISDDNLLINGIKAEIQGKTTNVLKVAISGLNKPYSVSVIVNNDTILCNTFFITKNNERKPLSCNF
ncbi:MAG: hypothetical protein AAFO82_15690 [Bacteroidota bacterium]